MGEPGFSFGPAGSAGPALICIHGLTGTPGDVRPPEELADTLQMACVGPLLPGHGTSVEELSRTKREQWRSALQVLFDELASSHACVYVLGFSLGGVLALDLCRHCPVQGALILAAPLDLGFGRRAAVRLLAPLNASKRRRRHFVDPGAAAGDRGYAAIPLRSVRELIALQREVRAELDQIHTPLRLLYARRDPTVHLRDSSVIMRGVGSKDVELEILECSGHMLLRDVERDRVAQWIAARLSEFETRRRGG